MRWPWKKKELHKADESKPTITPEFTEDDKKKLKRLIADRLYKDKKYKLTEFKKLSPDAREHIIRMLEVGKFLDIIQDGCNMSDAEERLWHAYREVYGRLGCSSLNNDYSYAKEQNCEYIKLAERNVTIQDFIRAHNDESIEEILANTDTESNYNQTDDKGE